MFERLGRALLWVILAAVLVWAMSRPLFQPGDAPTTSDDPPEEGEQAEEQ